MLDYKDIIIKHYALGMSGREIARTLSVSKTGVNSFLNAFKECKTLSYPLPEGITNYGIASAVYGSHTTVSGRDLTYELPDYEAVAKDTITDEREVKILFEILEKRCEINLSTIICSQREPASWSSMILNDEVSANAILKRATKHYTVVIKPKMTT